MNIDRTLAAAVHQLRDQIAENWDADESMPADYVTSSPLGKFVEAFHRADQVALCWLTYFAARRALPCWELSCRDRRPRRIIDIIGRHLKRGTEIDWSDATSVTPSPYVDCRYSDTQGASNAVANCARYIESRNPELAIYCISSADCACDHVHSEARFREWLLDYAIPAAFRKLDMTETEQNLLRERDSDKRG